MHAPRIVLAILVAATALAGAASGLTARAPVAAVAASPATAGAWEAPFEGQAAAVNMVLLKNGDVLYWSGVEAGDNDGVFFTSYPIPAKARVLHPPYTAASVATPLDPDGAAGDLFCSGQTVLPDGRVLVAGGSGWTEIQEDLTLDVVRGLKDGRVYDPETGAFHRVADMAVGRWYPTVLTDASGNAVAASGIQNLTNPVTLATSTEVYDALGNAWAPYAKAQDRLLPMYPRLFVVPGGPMKGSLYYQPDATMWGPFGEHPLEGLWSMEQVADKATGEWRYLAPSALGARQHGNTVMLPLSPANGYAPKLVTLGGTLQRSVLATPTTEVADLATDPPANAIGPMLNHERWYPNTVILPDGTLLATGGGEYDNVVLHGQPNVPVLSAEQYDPATASWTERASATVPRMYHSTAVLLPDGRVLTGGHVPLPIPFKAVRDNVPTQSQIVETRLEIYDPPYLFRGDRPVIEGATADAHYGGPITITTHDAAAIESVILIKPGATTHAWDSNERAVYLPIDARDGVHLQVKAPPDGDVASPGWYMMFVNKHTADGPVPSVATFIHLS